MRKIMIDLNVVLDVIQKRESHYNASAKVLARAHKREFTGVVPSHALTTIHYVVAKYKDNQTAAQTVDWLLAAFEIGTVGQKEFLQARTLKMADFEDAVFVSAALFCDCEMVVTRNVADFTNSLLPALTPEEFLANDLFFGK